jgi:hypothetical protein
MVCEVFLDLWCSIEKILLAVLFKLFYLAKERLGLYVR